MEKVRQIIIYDKNVSMSRQVQDVVSNPSTSQAQVLGCLKDGLRLIAAFGQIEKTKRRMLLALVESMIQVDR